VSETAPTLTTSDYLSEPLHVGEPDVLQSLAVFPIFGPAPVQPYVSFAQGRDAGVAIKELEGSASVNDLIVINPTATPVLLFEGEEVLGAQQNRTFDVTALIGANATETIPVSCMEAGRWDSTRHSEAFAPAPQTAPANLRRSKALMVSASLGTGGEARANQSAVWSEIEQRADRLQADAPTGALHDVYESRRDQLRRFNEAVELRDGQSGALVAIGGRFTVFDWVSRPDAYATLHPALIQGYALDAIETDEADAPTVEEAKGFVRIATGITSTERDGIGLGREVRFAAHQLIGTGLTAADELVQLTVHAQSAPGHERTGSGRIRRASRRRPR
jgi:hypothetical protein